MQLAAELTSSGKVAVPCMVDVVDGGELWMAAKCGEARGVRTLLKPAEGAGLSGDH